MVRPKRPSEALVDLRAEWKQAKNNATGRDWEQLQLFEIEQLGAAVRVVHEVLGDGGGGDC